MDQDASSERQMPRSALLAVNHALTTIHSAVGLRPTLEAIADGVTVSTPYQDVAVTIAQGPNAAELRVVAVVGPPDCVALLLNTTCQRTALLAHLAGGEAWGSLRFLPALESPDGIITYRGCLQSPLRWGGCGGLGMCAVVSVRLGFSWRVLPRGGSSG